MPYPDAHCVISSDENSTCEVVAAVTGTEQERNTGDSESDTLRDLQRRDQELAPVIHYLEAGILPEDSQLSRRIALTSSQHTVQDGMLYRVEDDPILRVIPPEGSRE